MGRKPERVAHPAKDIFKTAETFFQSCMCLELATRNDWTIAHYAVPKSVLAAFSLELYLKCLGTLYRGDAPKTHRLDKLFFDELDSKDQGNIKALYEEALKPELDHLLWEMEEQKKAGAINLEDPRDFDAILKNSAKAFEALRYTYDQGALGSKQFSAGLITAVIRQYIIRNHSDWNEAPKVTLLASKNQEGGAFASVLKRLGD